MTERQYTDDEIARIFRAAAEGAEPPASPGEHGDGLTLRDLHVIAREVGIAPEAVSRAARALERADAPAVSQRFLGLPVAVQRTVALDRRLTDAEWELLIVKLREVFHARGTVRAQGNLREWSNGNLHALLEPTLTGYQLRLGTFKGDARRSVAVGALMLGLAAVQAIMATTHGAWRQALPAVVPLVLIGAVFLGNGVLRLPSWARRRRQQMDEIVEHVARMMAANSTTPVASLPPQADD